MNQKKALGRGLSALIPQKGEPPVVSGALAQIPLDRITRLTLDQPTSSVGRNIAIGVASGVGATFGVLLLLAAIWGD